MPTTYITSLKHLSPSFYWSQLEKSSAIATTILMKHTLDKNQIMESTAVFWLHVITTSNSFIVLVAFIFSPVIAGVPCRQFNQVENGQFDLRSIFYVILQQYISFVQVIVIQYNTTMYLHLTFPLHTLFIHMLHNFFIFFYVIST
jgi:hypothetical protein